MKTLTQKQFDQLEQDSSIVMSPYHNSTARKADLADGTKLVKAWHGQVYAVVKIASYLSIYTPSQLRGLIGRSGGTYDKAIAVELKRRGLSC